jgi:hypothetical protein
MHAQQGVVSNCAADVRDMLTDLAYILEHAATATGTTNTAATHIAASSAVAAVSSSSGTAVDSMQVDGAQADIGNTSKLNHSDEHAKYSSQYKAGHENSAYHTAAVALVGSGAAMLSAPANTDQHLHYQYNINSSSTQTWLPSTPQTAAGTVYC